MYLLDLLTEFTLKHFFDFVLKKLRRSIDNPEWLDAYAYNYATVLIFRIDD